MVTPTHTERADYVDLAQRYRFLYGMSLQMRLATQGQDIVDWWEMGRKASGPTPVLTSAGPSHASVAAAESRRSGSSAAGGTVAEPEPHGETPFMSLPPAVREIIHTVAQERGVTVGDIMSWRKTGRIADARQECYRRLRAMPWRGDVPSLVQIGLWLHRDHTSVLHGLQKSQ